jgi:hypothetical protein
MCEAYVRLDEKIERYRKLIKSTSDRLAIESVQHLINEAGRRRRNFIQSKRSEAAWCGPNSEAGVLQASARAAFDPEVIN